MVLPEDVGHFFRLFTFYLEFPVKWLIT